MYIYIYIHIYIYLYIYINLKAQTTEVKTRVTWILKETQHTIKTFMDLVLHDINEVKKKKNPIFSLSNGKQEAMKYPFKSRDIIRTTAGKGGAVVIMDTENYIKETKHQLIIREI